jgi:hypothetical protein
MSLGPQDQTPERSFVIEDTRPNDPLQIVGFRVNGVILSPVPGFSVVGRTVNPGVSFQATDQAWLKGSSIVVRNVANDSRTVIGIWLSLFFPESYNGNTYVGAQISVGHVHPAGLYTRDGREIQDTTDPQIALLPGQTMEIPLGPRFEHLMDLFEKNGGAPSKMKVCKIRLSAAYFDDGTKWGPGWFGRPDPTNPGKYIQIMPSEFYGYRKRN